MKNLRTTITVIALLFFICHFGYTYPGYTDPFIGAYVFLPGDFYMLDYPVRIRTQPNLQGEVIGMLGMNSQIRIISSAGSDSVQEINRVRSLWYNIEYEDITGYIWGGYIAARTLIYDIDNNGIDDYFHCRVSTMVGPHYSYINALNDVVIYINNRKIPTTSIFTGNPGGRTNHVWGECRFEPTERNTVLIFLSLGTYGEYINDTFEIDKNGNIVLIKQLRE